MNRLLITMALLVSAAAGYSGILNADTNAFLKLNLYTEFGYTAVMSHTIQFGNDGTKLDYVRDFGQDVLFPYNRYEVSAELGSGHFITLVYQPIDVITEVLLTNSNRIQGVDFLSNTPMKTRYSFPYYRISYHYNFINTADTLLGAGLSIQLRNATINFGSLDGTLLTENRNLGIVPIIKLFFRQNLGAFSLGLEADGFYASSSLFNGATFEFEGSILDAVARAGFRPNDSTEFFLAGRFVGGTAKGTSQFEDRRYDGYTDNSLATFNLSLGITLR